jgi:hypothetical protein
MLSEKGGIYASWLRIGTTFSALIKNRGDWASSNAIDRVNNLVEAKGAFSLLKLKA